MNSEFWNLVIAFTIALASYWKLVNIFGNALSLPTMAKEYDEESTCEDSEMRAL